MFKLIVSVPKQGFLCMVRVQVRETLKHKRSHRIHVYVLFGLLRGAGELHASGCIARYPPHSTAPQGWSVG